MPEITGDKATEIASLVNSFLPHKADDVPDGEAAYEIHEIQFLRRIEGREEVRAVLYSINFFGEEDLYSPTYYYLYSDRAAFDDYNEDKATRPFYANSYNIEAVFDDLLSATTCFNQMSQAVGLTAADRVVNLRG